MKLALYVYLLSPMIVENLYALDIVILFICLFECFLLWLEYNANFFFDKKWNGLFLGLTLVQVSRFSLHHVAYPYFTPTEEATTLYYTTWFVITPIAAAITGWNVYI